MLEMLDHVIFCIVIIIRQNSLFSHKSCDMILFLFSLSFEI